MAPDDSQKASEPDKTESPPAEKKKGGWSWLSWERDVEILKIAVTFYAACIGTFVTFQFNERQHELNRIEAIAKMLPHLDEGEKASDSAPELSPPDAVAEPNSPEQKPPHKHESHKMTRDGAIWAIFRTANNKTMLRDLAALFPEDIYRVVSSIAASGGLNNDDDALTALQVASEKLANKYAANNDTVLASRLYHQAVKLKQRTKGSDESFPIVDITDQAIDEPTGEDHIAEMLRSLNKLGDLHRNESESSNKVSTGRWNAKQMYKRVRELGKKADSVTSKEEVLNADAALSELYLKDHRADTARIFLNDALNLKRELEAKGVQLSAAMQSRLTRLQSEIDAIAPLSSSSTVPAGQKTDQTQTPKASVPSNRAENK